MNDESLRSIMRIFGRAEELLDALCEFEEPLSGPVFTPPLDILFSEERLWLIFEIPGVQKEDMRLWVAPQLVFLTGMRQPLIPAGRSKPVSFYQLEISYGRFERRVQLPYSVDPNSCEVRFNRGVLGLTLLRSVPRTRIVPIE
jgi:HSP20 family molecular chaperone IbpA